MTNQLYSFAFLDNENKVINVSVFDSENPDTSLLEDIKNIYNATDYKSCTVYGEAYINGFFINNRFILPKPYPSWILNDLTYEWEAPIPYPQIEDGSDEFYTWDEQSLSWLLLPPLN